MIREIKRCLKPNRMSYLLRVQSGFIPITQISSGVSVFWSSLLFIANTIGENVCICYSSAQSACCFPAPPPPQNWSSHQNRVAALKSRSEDKKHASVDIWGNSSQEITCSLFLKPHDCFRTRRKIQIMTNTEGRHLLVGGPSWQECRSVKLLPLPSVLAGRWKKWKWKVVFAISLAGRPSGVCSEDVPGGLLQVIILLWFMATSSSSATPSWPNSCLHNMARIFRAQSWASLDQILFIVSVLQRGKCGASHLR